MLSAKDIAEYQETILQIKEVETRLQRYFILLSQIQSVQYDRCSDFGERGVSLFIPFDHINIHAFEPDNIEKIKSDLGNYIQLRNKQKKIELDIDAHKSINQSNRAGTNPLLQ